MSHSRLPRRPKLPAAIALAAFACGAADATDQVSGLSAAAAQHGGRAADAGHAGIWKAVTPPAGSMHGEFGGNDPFGLAVGARIPADCSLNWIDPDSRKLYCFSSATSLVYFLDAPHAYLARARKRWAALSGG